MVEWPVACPLLEVAQLAAVEWLTVAVLWPRVGWPGAA